MPESRPRICVVGSINMDLVIAAPRLPRPGETLLGGRLERHPGGKGANQAVAAARLGAAVSLVGAVGDDEHGRVLRGVLGEEGVDLTHVTTRPDRPTGVGLITVASAAAQGGDGGENTIVVASGANAAVRPADVEAARAAIQSADVLLLQLELPIDTTVAAAGVAREAGATVVLNAAPAASLPDELLSLVDVLVCNEPEAHVLTEHLDVEVEAVGDAWEADGAGGAGEAIDDGPPAHDILLAKLAALGAGASVLTLGARGATFMHRDAGRDVPAFPADVVDSVGAGDAFVGALAVRWAEHRAGGRFGTPEVADAVRWGCAAGSLAVTRPGAIPSMPRRADVARIIAGT